MTEFRDAFGAVYVFENVEAQRIKVGMTINNVTDRLRDVNDKWSRIKVTCQICGTQRLADSDNFMPAHVGSGIRCAGSRISPLEDDRSIAKTHLENLRNDLNVLTGAKRSAVSKKIKTLQKRIAFYEQYKRPEGIWQFRLAFYTHQAERVELLSHEVLADKLDQSAPFGEVFCCSVSQAAEAIESVLDKLGLLNTVRKDVQSDDTSEKYGNCSICGGNLTKRGSCPACVGRLFIGYK